MAAGNSAKSPGSAPTTTGNSALDRVIGNDEALRSFVGISPNSPVPTPTVTSEGVPLQEWDFFGGTAVLVKPAASAEPSAPTSEDVQELISKGLFKANARNVERLLLGDRKVFGIGFDKLLLQLSLVPAGSVKSLNIIAHCTSVFRMDFNLEFVHTRGTDDLDHTVEESTQRPLQNIELNEIISLLATPEISVDGIPVKLADVRKAFPVDAEVRVFNMSNPLREEFIQALSNLFLVRTSGFAKKPVRVSATFIAEGTGDEPILTRKVDIGFIGDPIQEPVDFFAHLLQKDRALTGLFTAFPRR